MNNLVTAYLNIELGIDYLVVSQTIIGFFFKLNIKMNEDDSIFYA